MVLMLWRRVALWSNSSWSAKAIFYTVVFSGCWYSGETLMSWTNQRTMDPEQAKRIEANMTPDQRYQTDMAMRTVQKLLDDIQSGKEQKRGWKPGEE